MKIREWVCPHVGGIGPPFTLCATCAFAAVKTHEIVDQLVSPEVVEAAATGHREKSYEGPKTSVALSLAALSAARAFLLKP